MREGVALAPLTTLGLGGRARYFLEAPDGATLAAALGWARDEGLPAVLLAGGSNVVVADAGVDGLVVRMAQRGVRRDRAREAAEAGGDRAAAESGSGGAAAELWTVAAGEPWDPLVERAVAAGLAGIECLSGIPGTAGATPIQNVGAYGQEVSQVIESVRVLDRSSLAERELAPEECAFGYRDSRFRHRPERHAVLAVTFRLAPGGAAATRYPELARAVAATGEPPTLAAVRRTVLALRRAKSMVIEPGDDNRRSVGSFFVNPVLPAAEAEAVVARALAAGAARDPTEVPRFAAGAGPAGPAGQVKLSAGWLIERAGFPKGTRRGAVGISSRHALALVHHGGGTTADLLALAREVRRAVRDRFGVTLRPEPVFLGFGEADPLSSA
ncbi:MAG TPA: UDP-N-acetylmuramate dehydrogenase [Thermoanaerobaculia bacterium]|nr:UDP-N-acetylmuramate dehydrogenase [Thermoanaerobaculia bacterium]